MTRTSNDQRSDSKNPTSREDQQAQDKRSRQLDPNNPEHGGGQARQEPSERDFAPGEDGECH
jgi:hypothetical protein